MLGSEGARVSRRFVTESLGRVVVKCGLHIGNSGVEGSGGESGPSNTGGGEHGIPDMCYMLIQQQLITSMARDDGVDPHKAVPASVVGASLSPSLTDEYGSVSDVRIWVG